MLEEKNYKIGIRVYVIEHDNNMNLINSSALSQLIESDFFVDKKHFIPYAKDAMEKVINSLTKKRK